MKYLKELLLFVCFLVITCHGKPLEERQKRETLNFCDSENVFKCSSGLCIPAVWKCDGAADCPGADDERDCGQPQPQPLTIIYTMPPKIPECPEGQFECEPSQCIPNWKLCDGNKDCSNSADEIGCSTQKNITPKTTIQTHVRSCPQGRFYCESDDICIPESWTCNGSEECSNGEDEESCEASGGGSRDDSRESDSRESTTIPPTTIKSSTTKSIFNVTTPLPTPSSSRCSANSFYCASNNICIPRNWHCDGAKDCSHGEDEKGCEIETTPKTTTPFAEVTSPVDSICNANQFHCIQNKLCIPKTWHCDGMADCMKGEDEKDCESTNEYPAESSTPLFSTKKTTEMTTTPVPSPSTGCSSDQFSCKYSRECIPESWQCDGENDCNQGEDEENCDETTIQISTTERLTTSETTTPIFNLTTGKVTTSKCSRYGEYFCEHYNRCIPLFIICVKTTPISPSTTEAITYETTTEQTPEIISPSANYCRSTEFYCKYNRICIPITWRCDGQQDCSQAEDEDDCQETTIASSTASSSSSESTTSSTASTTLRITTTESKKKKVPTATLR